VLAVCRESKRCRSARINRTARNQQLGTAQATGVDGADDALSRPSEADQRGLVRFPGLIVRSAGRPAALLWQIRWLRLPINLSFRSCRKDVAGCGWACLRFCHLNFSARFPPPARNIEEGAITAPPNWIRFLIEGEVVVGPRCRRPAELSAIDNQLRRSADALQGAVAIARLAQAQGCLTVTTRPDRTQPEGLQQGRQANGSVDPLGAGPVPSVSSAREAESPCGSGVSIPGHARPPAVARQ